MCSQRTGSGFKDDISSSTSVYCCCATCNKKKTKRCAQAFVKLVCVCAYLYQDTIELLQARISALDSATLDQVEARLQVTNCSVQCIVGE